MSDPTADAAPAAVAASTADAAPAALAAPTADAARTADADPAAGPAEREGNPPARGPGDTRPRMLARPPGERYLRASRVMPPMERPRLARALLVGLGAVAGVVVVSALLRDILDLSFGLLVVAGVGGWAIGAGVRQGAWGGRPHLGSRILSAVGVSLGALCWLLGLVAAWLLSMAILPGSSRSFTDRLAATPFVDWIGPQLDPLDYIQLLLLAGIAWYVARSGAVRASA